MNLIPMTTYEAASPAAQHEYDDQVEKNGRVTNMKRTLLHSVPAFKAYMEWYTLRDLLVPFIGERGVALFSYAISTTNECLVCSMFFRKILIDAGDDPDNPTVNEAEQLLLDFGHAIAREPNAIPPALYDRVKARFNTEQTVLLIAFAGIMAATNLFNEVAKIPLDEVLYASVPAAVKKKDYAPDSLVKERA